MDREAVFKTLKVDEGVKYEDICRPSRLPHLWCGALVTNEDTEWGQEFGTPVSEERVWECFEKDLDTSISECHVYTAKGSLKSFPRPSSRSWST